MQIRSERDAIDFLLNCWHDTAFGMDRPLSFKTCTLSIRLDPGDGQGDWKMARAVGLLQRHLNLTYLLAKRGAPSGRLNEFDKERLSIAFTVEPGSTTINIDISKALTAILQALPAHWPMRTRNMVGAGVLIATITFPFVHEYAVYRAETDKAKISAAAAVYSSEQTNRANREIAKIHANAQFPAATVASPSASSTLPASALPVILANLASEDTSRVTAFAVSDYVPWRPALMVLAPYAGTIQWNDSRPVPARAAKAIAKTVRTEATAQRRIAKQKGQPGLIATPWVTEVLRVHQAPGAMRLGLSQA